VFTETLTYHNNRKWKLATTLKDQKANNEKKMTNTLNRQTHKGRKGQISNVTETISSEEWSVGGGEKKNFMKEWGVTSDKTYQGRKRGGKNKVGGVTLYKNHTQGRPGHTWPTKHLQIKGALKWEI